MDNTDHLDFIAPAPELRPGARRPRIALMGEFSAGKSTLSNLLIGASPLPTKVTATQLPPVWISWGEDAPWREDLEGEKHPIELEDLAGLNHADTRVIRLFRRSDILEMCDIIDMPGISDPNMAAEVWERMIDKADAVIWCTHATQAWRQSEAAVWETLDPSLRRKSLLLVTRFDRLLTDKDRRRVIKRIERETAGLFRSIYPVSLTQALAAGENREQWDASGAEAFTQAFVDLIHELTADLQRSKRPVSTMHQVEHGAEAVRSAPQPHIAPPEKESLRIGDTAITRPVSKRVMPTRVRPVSRLREAGERPDPNEASGF